MEDVEIRILCAQVSIELDQRVKIAILPELGEVRVLLIRQRTLNVFRSSRANHDHWARIELEAASDPPAFGVQQRKKPGFRLFGTGPARPPSVDLPR